MNETYIYDLADILLQLEAEVIRHVVNINTLPQTRLTVQLLKEAWLMDRLEEMNLITFHPFLKRTVPDEIVHALKNLAMPTPLDKYLYHTMRIPPHCSSMVARLEIRYNDLYLYFS